MIAILSCHHRYVIAPPWLCHPTAVAYEIAPPSLCHPTAIAYETAPPSLCHHIIITMPSCRHCIFMADKCHNTQPGRGHTWDIRSVLMTGRSQQSEDAPKENPAQFIPLCECPLPHRLPFISDNRHSRRHCENQIVSENAPALAFCYIDVNVNVNDNVNLITYILFTFNCSLFTSRRCKLMPQGCRKSQKHTVMQYFFANAARNNSFMHIFANKQSSESLVCVCLI